MFVPNRDWAVLEPIEDAGKLKRGDIVLFRRAGSILVMHRIYRVTGKTGLREFWFVGDNQPAVEKGIRQEQLCGILTHFIRNGRQHSVREPGYLIISGLWLWLRPLRPLFHVCMKFFRRVGKNRGAGHNRGK
ncbi:MAG: S24/S26 family peptidase [Bilifractor sp.]